MIMTSRSTYASQHRMAQHAVRHRLGGYWEYAPPEPLAPFCESVWLYQTPPDLALATHRVLPDLAFNIGVTCVRGWDGRVHDAHAWLSAPKIRPLMATFPSGRETVAIKIKLEWASVVAGVVCGECRDTDVPLADIRPSLTAGLIDVLDASRSIHEVACGLIDTVSNFIRPPRWRGPMMASHALDAVRRTDGRVSIDRVATHVGVSPRYLRRIVHRDAGLSPKMYARTLRFLSAMRLADARPRTSNGVWAGIAVESGFFDQSHLIRESRALTGLTPQNLWEERHSEVNAELNDARVSALLA